MFYNLPQGRYCGDLAENTIHWFSSTHLFEVVFVYKSYNIILTTHISLPSVTRPSFKPLSPCLSDTSTCVLPLSLPSLPLHLPHCLFSSFLHSPSTTCWAAAWRVWGAVRRPRAPTVPKTPLRRPCPPPHPTPSPTPPLRACRLPLPSLPTPITPGHTPSRCPSSSPAPQSLPHGPWVFTHAHKLLWLWCRVCMSVHVDLFCSF